MKAPTKYTLFIVGVLIAIGFVAIPQAAVWYEEEMRMAFQDYQHCVRTMPIVDRLTPDEDISDCFRTYMERREKIERKYSIVRVIRRATQI